LSTPTPQQQKYNEKNYSDNEKYLRESGRGAGDPAESQQSGNHGDDEKYQSPVQHRLAFTVVEGPAAPAAVPGLTVTFH
jgi:hypothetical protein